MIKTYSQTVMNLIIRLLYCPKCETVFKVLSSGYREVLHVRLVRCEIVLENNLENFDK